MKEAIIKENTRFPAHINNPFILREKSNEHRKGSGGEIPTTPLQHCSHNMA